ncbi:MAG: heavy-metal-associated domain-containing protein [Bacteroidales bacterium]|jgi:copper chaperone CopZ|nr:heavy-metal-associated domain-containing protein [Bacteroidales bacterium]
MKTRKLLFTMVTFLIAGTMVFAQEMKTEKFKVYGNCGMCENRIEKAALGLDGVTKADWDKDTEMLEVAFVEEKVNVDDIHQAVAEAAHDTDKVKAVDEVYQALPACCLYR